MSEPWFQIKIKKLEKENELLKKNNAALESSSGTVTFADDAVIECLNFYASPENWSLRGTFSKFSHAGNDKGSKARQCLEVLNERVH